MGLTAVVARVASDRLRWAVETVAARPDERLLEVGCGQGVAVGLVAATLTTGRITGLDRSAKMIGIAVRANRVHVEAGRAELRTGSLERADLPAAAFDTVFAVRVAAFWTRAATALPAVRRLLAPGGRLLVFAQEPGPVAGSRALERMRAGLDAHAFLIQEVREQGPPTAGTCVVARLPGGA